MNSTQLRIISSIDTQGMKDRLQKLMQDGSQYVRNRMPQLDDKKFDIIIDKLNKRHGVYKERVPLSQLKCAQNEYNIQKVKKMVYSGHEYNKRNYLVSNSYELVDATHARLCGEVVDPSVMVDVYRVPISTGQLIKALNMMSETFNKELNESQKQMLNSMQVIVESDGQENVLNYDIQDNHLVLSFGESTIKLAPKDGVTVEEMLQRIKTYVENKLYDKLKVYMAYSTTPVV